MPDAKGKAIVEGEKGYIKVDDELRTSTDGVWALGDCAVVPDPHTGKAHPPTAQHALREAKTVAGNIAAVFGGRELRAFDFRTIGQLAAIGDVRRPSIADLIVAVMGPKTEPRPHLNPLSKGVEEPKVILTSALHVAEEPKNDDKDNDHREEAATKLPGSRARETSTQWSFHY